MCGPPVWEYWHDQAPRFGIQMKDLTVQGARWSCDGQQPFWPGVSRAGVVCGPPLDPTETRGLGSGASDQLKDGVATAFCS